MALLEINHLEVRFASKTGDVRVLQDLCFQLEKGERVAIVGESGAGKSIAAFAILKLISRPGFIHRGEIVFEGQDIVPLSGRAMRHLRGNRISMIFQDPMTTLNPVLTIGTQMVESLHAHRSLSKKQARDIAIDKLQQVQIASPEKRFDQYPHEISGGMRQRIVIAIALLLNPSLIIADEPTTALDVTIQAQIMELLMTLCESQQCSLILISHDLGVVANTTHKTMVMYAGRIIEMGPTSAIIHDAQHPYTQGLIRALPASSQPGQRLNQIPGSMPSPQHLPSGCAFHPRCGEVLQACSHALPSCTYRLNGKHRVACHLFTPPLISSGNN